jgi:putative acetyltransferase
MQSMVIEPLDPGSIEAHALIAESDAFMASLYPAGSVFLASIESLMAPNVLLLGGRIDAELVACGAARTLIDATGTYGEIKRVFVRERHRGKGLSRAIMRRLEAHLVASGVGTARLETGVRQPQALALYRSIGYVERAPFGDYPPDPLSVFLEKRLEVPGSRPALV